MTPLEMLAVLLTMVVATIAFDVFRVEEPP